MITEEKLQNLLDNLRLGKYDTDQYEIEAGVESLSIKDLHTNTKLSMAVYETSSAYCEAFNKWVAHSKLWKFFHEEPSYGAYPFEYKVSIAPRDCADCIISEELYKSFVSYCRELREKDSLIRRSNIESSFGL